MKRYVIFGGDIFYAGGGAIDYLIDVARKDTALAYRKQYLQLNPDHRWCHVFDTKNIEIIPLQEDEHGAVEGHH